MNAITKTFPLHHSRAHRNSRRSIWRDSGIGLAIVLTVLIMTVVGTRGNSGVQTIGTWPGAGAPNAAAGWERSIAHELFPLGPVTSEAPM
jgi:hypothetical protein